MPPVPAASSNDEDRFFGDVCRILDGEKGDGRRKLEINSAPESTEPRQPNRDVCGRLHLRPEVANQLAVARKRRISP